jgi:hypothetical protein
VLVIQAEVVLHLQPGTQEIMVGIVMDQEVQVLLVALQDL